MRSLIPKLPHSFNPNRGGEVRGDLIGATIVAVGTSDEQVEGGGLILDYRPQKKNRVCRLILAFNELGMWIHRKATLDADQESDF